jgi:hypothetical protein
MKRKMFATNINTPRTILADPIGDPFLLVEELINYYFLGVILWETAWFTV